MAERSAKAQAAVDAVKPSSSTVASTAGGAVTTIVLWLIESLTGPIPAPVAAAFTVLGVIAAGYFFPGGRSADTK